MFGNLAAVISGTAAAQAVVFAFSPLITRIYSPEIFGLQGVFLSLISILSPVIALRYPMAIVVANDEGDVQHLSRLAILIAFALSVLLALALALGQRPISVLLGAEGLGLLIWFLPLALFSVALQDVADFRAVRSGVFRLVGKVTVAQAFLANLARVLGGLAFPSAATLVVVTSIAPTLQALMLTWGGRKTRAARGPTTTRGKARALLRAHRDFPLFRMPTDVLNAASQAMPVILLTSLFSPAAAGLYALTRSVLNLPTNIIGAAMGNVIYARFADLARENRSVTPLLLRSTAALLLLTPPILAATWFAPTVFAFVFGEEWRGAGVYARWMALWIGIALANIPAVKLAPVIKAQAYLLVANILMLALRVVSIVWVARLNGTAGMAVAAFSVASAFGNAGLIGGMMIAARRYENARRRVTFI